MKKSHLFLMPIKKCLLLTMLLFLVFLTNAQTMKQGFESEDFTNLRTGTLYIVPTGNAIFDDSLKIAVEKYWKISPSKALLKTELEQYLGDEKNCFISLMIAGTSESTTSLEFSDDPCGKGFHNLFIFHGGKHNKKQMNSQTILGKCPFYFYEPKYNMNCLGFIVKQFNDDSQRIIDKQITGPKVVGGVVTKKWDVSYQDKELKGIKALQTKTLLVNEELLKYPLPEKILAAYKYKYKVVNAAEMISLMQTAPNKYCFLSDEDIVRAKTIRIFDVLTQGLIYEGYGSGSAMKISDKQISDLNDAIAK